MAGSVQKVKHVVCIPDGCADQPVGELGDRTPLEAADMPVLAGLAKRGQVGRAQVIPAGMSAGSDVGTMSILGYDPAGYHTGRAPIEAAALGLRLPEDRIAFRCNLVTLGDDGTMIDFAGGHPASDLAAQVIADLQETLGGGEVSFHPGVQYRHVLVAPRSWLDAECTPPHDLTGQAAVWPRGEGSEALVELIARSEAVLARHPEVKATHIWLWGQGSQPSLPSFSSLHGVEAGLVTAVDLVRGLGVLAEMQIVDVPGATGWYDTDYEGKRDACLKTLEAGVDLFVIHVEATDEAGHAGDVAAKVQSLENWDSRILGPLVEGLDGMGPWRMLLMPDHATPLALRTHTPDPVPFLIVDSESGGPGGVYSEAGAAAGELVAGHRLIGRLLGR